MATSWTRVAGDICSHGLGMLGVTSPGQSIPATDMQTALDALDAVLKELPLHGYSWPKLSAETSLTWTGQTFTLPTDYYGYPVVWSDGRQIHEIQHHAWNALTDKSPDGESVTHFYISPASVLYVYPNPTSDPVLTLQYQRLVTDVAQGSAPDMPQFWINVLGYGVANELLLDFPVDERNAQRIEKRWASKRDLAIRNSVSSAAISFSVSDDMKRDPDSWTVAPDDGVADGGTP